MFKPVVHHFVAARAFNFSLGIRLPDLWGRLYLFRANVAFLKQDEKAHKTVWAVKGAAGFRAC